MAVRREPVRRLSARPAGRSSMDRVRRAGTLALFLLIAVIAVATVPAAPAEPGGRAAAGRLVAAVAGPAAVDLAGLEIAYVTSTGGTVTRKATWPTSTILEAGRHLLIANSTGIYAATADATYSGGFAAAGGAIVLRPIGGTPIDAVGWGDATNA